MALIKATNIVKDYSGHRALDNLNITVDEGTIYGLLGPNGAGKTTFIRILNQITKPDSGDVFFNGHKLCPTDIELIGYLPEERGLYKKMRVGEQALFLAQLKGMSKADATTKLKMWFEKFGISDWWYKKVEELSKGMQQKVQFITTVLHEPRLLIFDEPFSGFDPVNANLLKNEILQLKENGATIIFSTHNMSSVEEICDNITLINKSKAVLTGSVWDVKQKYKECLFNIKFVGDANNLTTDETLEITNIKQERDYQTALVRPRTNMTANELIRYMIEKIELISFEEKLPSMNEIFIKTVSQK